MWDLIVSVLIIAYLFTLLLTCVHLFMHELLPLNDN